MTVPCAASAALHPSLRPTPVRSFVAHPRMSSARLLNRTPTARALRAIVIASLMLGCMTMTITVSGQGLPLTADSALNGSDSSTRAGATAAGTSGNTFGNTSLTSPSLSTGAGYMTPQIQGADIMPTPLPVAASAAGPASGATPPAKPNEFQRFVEATIGRRLPLFGTDFFAQSTHFDPSLPVASDHLVGAGDELIIRAWGSVDVNYRAVVDRTGQITLPKVGNLTVAGTRASDVEARIKAHMSRLYNNFSVNVSLGRLRGITVFVVGQATRAGAYTLSSQSTLVAAVMASGGPGPNGSMRRVSVRRNGTEVGAMDLYDLLVQGDKSRDLALLSGDTVVFHPAGPRVALSGTVDNPAIFELKADQEPLEQLLKYAGGVPAVANSAQIQLERIDGQDPQGPRSVRQFSLDQAGRALPLRDGDLISFSALSNKFSNAVTLKGHVALPMRHTFTPGMRLRDLIPDKDVLITADYHRRKNLMVQVQPMSIEDLSELTAYRRHFNADTSESQLQNSVPPNRPPGSQGAPSANGVPPSSNGSPPSLSPPQPRLSREQLLAQDLDRAQRASKRPAELLNEVNWEYGVIERLNPQDLSTQLITFSPRKLILEQDAQANIALQAGDVVTIFGQHDLRVPVSQQTRVVSVEGEVAHAGIYQLAPGDTLRSLIERAGGLTPQAYVYGLEFSREETRRRQMENLQAAISRLEALTATQTARNAANLSGDVSAAAAAQTSQSATEAQLRHLRSMQPNGRIAMELGANAADLSALPEVPLEGGDRIVIPPKPGFVTVAGAVANSNAFLWRPARTVQDFLKMAGVEESADLSQMFILRADGTVLHSTDRRGFLGLGGGLYSQVLHPGDALIVPSQLDYETWGRALVRNLKDWSQIFYQFGLGAAAIVTLRNN